MLGGFADLEPRRCFLLYFRLRQLWVYVYGSCCIYEISMNTLYIFKRSWESPFIFLYVPTCTYKWLWHLGPTFQNLLFPFLSIVRFHFELTFSPKAKCNFYTLPFLIHWYGSRSRSTTLISGIRRVWHTLTRHPHLVIPCYVQCWGSGTGSACFWTFRIRIY
jgi:hypothetical protein